MGLYDGGIPFTIPFLCATNMPTGDRRIFRSLDLAPMPLPFGTQFADLPGHDGSVSTGRLLSVTANMDGSFSAYGVFDLHPDGLRAARLAATQSMMGVSIEPDEFDAEMLEDGSLDIAHARIRGASQVRLPAWAECQIVVDPADVDAAEAELAALPAESRDVHVHIVAAGGPAAPPREWFANPELAELTHIDITDDGRVFGHLADWQSCHISFPGVCRSAPSSAAGYAYFNTGQVVCADGSRVACGVLTLGAGHADKRLGARAAVDHYDNTATVVADVVAGEDEHGIWLAGALRPDVTDADKRALLASDQSGDWRSIGGNLELVAALCVNTPGFPIPRLSMLVASGECQALVAAGIVPRPITENDRIETLERAFAPMLRPSADAHLARIRGT